jgi:hypothetical protein
MTYPHRETQPAGRPRRSDRSLAALLHEGTDELLRVHLEHVVDLVQQRVDLRIQLRLVRAVGRRDLVDIALFRPSRLVLVLL